MRFATCASLLIAFGLAGCNNKPDNSATKPGGPPATLITTAKASTLALDVTEDKIGRAHV